ncbi:hypothetical protein [Halomonas sp. M20]|uniref:hypothetical protein n=1 Tax=Halomonas sp. M20 TaxID=2763264 RepID=UPI001D09CDE5|nr:hypothetical protein [Halomonas sp. M20]
MSLINYRVRIVICGQKAQYNDASSNSGAVAPQILIKKSVKIKGFVVYDYQGRNDEAIEHFGKWIKEDKQLVKLAGQGSLKARYDAPGR